MMCGEGGLKRLTRYYLAAWAQLRFHDSEIRMAPLEVFWARPTGRRPRGRPRTYWGDYISHLALERLRIPQDELENVAGERDVWTTLLACCRNPTPDKQQKIDDGFCVCLFFQDLSFQLPFHLPICPSLCHLLRIVFNFVARRE